MNTAALTYPVSPWLDLIMVPQADFLGAPWGGTGELGDYWFPNDPISLLGSERVFQVAFEASCVDRLVTYGHPLSNRLLATAVHALIKRGEVPDASIGYARTQTLLY